MASKKMIKAIELLVTTKLSQREIAKELDISEETVSRYKKNTEYDSIKKEFQESYLNELVAPAMKTMESLLKAKSEFVRYNAAKDILDRTGYTQTEKLDVSIETPTIISGSDELED